MRILEEHQHECEDTWNIDSLLQCCSFEEMTKRRMLLSDLIDLLRDEDVFDG